MNTRSGWTYAEFMIYKSEASRLDLHPTADCLQIIRSTMELYPSEPITHQQLARSFLRNRECTCIDTSVIPFETQVDIQSHWLQHDFRTFLECSFILDTFEFMTLHQNRFPTFLQLASVTARRLRISMNVEAYCNDNDVKVGTANLQSLPTEQYVVGLGSGACALCQEDIVEESKVFKMPCCGQYFHQSAPECLGETTVIHWLEQSKKCPSCNQDVILKAPSKRVLETDNVENVPRKKKKR